MAIQGKLIATANGFQGKIASESMDRTIQIVKNDRGETKPNSPDYRVITPSPGGTMVDVGAVWRRQSRAENEFLSMTLKIDGVAYNANIFPDTSIEGDFYVAPWAE